MEARVFQSGGVWEENDWKIAFSENRDLKGACKHAIPTEDKEEGYYNPQCIVPRVVVGTNEGGYNGTGICLDCIVEAAKTL